MSGDLTCSQLVSSYIQVRPSTQLRPLSSKKQNASVAVLNVRQMHSSLVHVQLCIRVPACQACECAAACTCVHSRWTFCRSAVDVMTDKGCCCFPQRISAYDRLTNAVRVVIPDVMNTAAAMDAQLEAYVANGTDLPLLFCVPILLKDNYDALDGEAHDCQNPSYFCYTSKCPHAAILTCYIEQHCKVSTRLLPIRHCIANQLSGNALSVFGIAMHSM